MKRAVSLVLLFSCAAPEDIPVNEFAGWAADVLCRRTRECMRGTFDSAFYDLGDCRATVERQYDAMIELQDEFGCDYSAARAGEAYVDIDEMSCEQFYEGDSNESLNEIWTDCGGYYTDTDYTYTYYYF